MYIIKNIVFFFILSTAIIAPKNDVKLLYGKWNIDKVENIKTNKTFEVSRFLDFKKDDVLEGGLINKKADNFGKWKLNTNKDIITISSSNDKASSKDGDFLILDITEKELVIKKDNIKVYFIKA